MFLKISESSVCKKKVFFITRIAESTKQVYRCLVGAVQTGSWLCLSHAELLPMTSLSTLAQSISDIFHSYKLIKSQENSTNLTRLNMGKHNLKVYLVYQSIVKLK